VPRFAPPPSPSTASNSASSTRTYAQRSMASVSTNSTGRATCVAFRHVHRPPLSPWATPPPPSPRATPRASCCLRHLASHRRAASVALLRVVVEREREREARQEPGCSVRRRPPTRLPGTTLVSSQMASRSGENSGLQIGREWRPPGRERTREEREWKRERWRIDGREP
jgi:hypothetical protein